MTSQYELIDYYSNFKIEIIGNIPYHFKSKINEELKQNNLYNNIILRGFIGYDEAQKFIFRSKIGLCLLYPTPNYYNSYPTKIFDYMNSAIPIIASDFGYSKRIIEESKCGISIDIYNDALLFNSIKTLLEDSDKCKRLGKNGYDYMVNNYNWLSEEKKIISIYSNLLSEHV